MSTGHLPKSVDEMYASNATDSGDSTAEVPLTSMHADEILDEASLPIRLCAETACFRREAGAAGRDTRGVLRVHEFDKVELFAYCTPSRVRRPSTTSWRAESLLQELGLTYRLLNLCTAISDVVGAHDRPRSLQPRSGPLARSLFVSWFPTTRPVEHTCATARATGRPRWCTP